MIVLYLKKVKNQESCTSGTFYDITHRCYALYGTLKTFEFGEK